MPDFATAELEPDAGVEGPEPPFQPPQLADSSSPQLRAAAPPVGTFAAPLAPCMVWQTPPQMTPQIAQCPPTAFVLHPAPVVVCQAAPVLAQPQMQQPQQQPRSSFQKLLAAIMPGTMRSAEVAQQQQQHQQQQSHVPPGSWIAEQQPRRANGQ